MHRLLIVDDEKLIRKGVIAKLAHNNVAFSWVGEASNGKEALDLIETEHPDIVITDVRMPVMDGIQLIRQCRENSCKARFIIISGYAEFAYAEQALNMGVSAYILKPIDDANLVETMKKVMKEISCSLKAQENAREVAVLGKDKEMLLTERILNQIFHTSLEYKDRLPEQLGLRETACSSSFILAILNIDGSSYYNSPFKYGDLVLVKFSIKNILDEIECDCLKVTADNQRDINQIFILFHGTEKNRLKICCDNYIRNAYTKIRNYLQVSITIGLSGLLEKLTNELYKQARIAFEQRLIMGSNQMFYFEKITGLARLSVPEHKLKLLQRCIEISDLNGVQSILNDLFLSNEAGDVAGIYIRLVYSEVINTLLKVCTGYGLKSPTDSDFLSGEIIDYFEDSRQIASYLYTMIADILTGKLSDKVNCKKVVEDVKAYVENNYAGEITVGELARMYSINPDYLSVIFKQETGKNIIKYLTEIRIRKACKLLRETQSKVSDISYIVGYNDRQYFNRVFKKITGTTPAEYRNLKKDFPVF